MENKKTLSLKEIDDFFLKFYSGLDDEEVVSILKDSSFDLNIKTALGESVADLIVTSKNFEHFWIMMKKHQEIFSHYKSNKEDLFSLMESLDFTIQDFAALTDKNKKYWFKCFKTFLKEDFFTFSNKKEVKILEGYMNHLFRNEGLPKVTEFVKELIKEKKINNFNTIFEHFSASSTKKFQVLIEMVIFDESFAKSKKTGNLKI